MLILFPVHRWLVKTPASLPTKWKWLTPPPKKIEIRMAIHHLDPSEVQKPSPSSTLRNYPLAPCFFFSPAPSPSPRQSSPRPRPGPALSSPSAWRSLPRCCCGTPCSRFFPPPPAIAFIWVSCGLANETRMCCCMWLLAVCLLPPPLPLFNLHKDYMHSSRF